MNKKILIISIIALAIDQISKTLIESYIKIGESKTIISNFFNLTMCHNEGAAFSILERYPIIIIIASLLALVFIYKFIYSFKNNIRNNIAFGLLIGGLFGNLIDRIFLGYVRDFLDFYIIKYDYPVFNIADIAICIGVFLLIIAVFKGEDLSDSRSKKRK